MNEERNNKKDSFESGETQGMDWKLFEMAEGNLTEAEAIELMNAIDNDQGLAEEFEVMKLSGLVPETIVYPHKDKLMMKETPVIMLNWWWQYRNLAASIVAILLLALPLYIFLQQGAQPELSSGAMVESVTAPSADTKKGLQESPGDAGITNARITDEAATINYSKIGHTQTITTPYHTSRHKGLDKSDQHIALSETPDMVSGLNPKSTINLARKALNPANEMVEVDNRGLQRPLIVIKNNPEYQGIRATMNHAMATLIEPVRNTNIKVRNLKQKGDPGLQIEVSTEQYYAVAQVHLLPRGNR